MVMVMGLLGRLGDAVALTDKFRSLSNPDDTEFAVRERLNGFSQDLTDSQWDLLLSNIRSRALDRNDILHDRMGSLYEYGQQLRPTNR